MQLATVCHYCDMSTDIVLLNHIFAGKHLKTLKTILAVLANTEACLQAEGLMLLKTNKA